MFSSQPQAASLQGIHWHKSATSLPAQPTLDKQIDSDFVIVGGGLTGTRTALGLAENGASVVLLESKSIGSGASGRSGGQCNPMWRATPAQLAKRLGEACASRLVDTTLASADALFEDIRKYKIDCDAEQAGWVQAAHCQSAQRDLETLATGWNNAGASIELQDRVATHKASGSNAYGFSLFHPRGGHVHPLSLTRGFARTAQSFGAQLFENSPVLSMTRSGTTWTVKTPSGSVTTKQVILTTNAYTDDLWPELRQTFYPLVSISLATAALSPELQKTVLPNSVTIADTRRAIYYSRYDRDKRLVFGCVGSTDDPAALGGIKRLKRGMLTVFPQLAGIDIEATWAGRIAVTPEMMPHLHEPDSGVIAALGFSGRGIAMTSVMARTVVSKALGADENTLPFLVSPISRISAHSVKRVAIPLAAPAMTMRDKLDTVFDAF